MADFGRQLADMVQGQEAPTQQPQSPRIARLLDADRLKKLEAALTVGSGIAASVPAGLAGMAQMIPTRGRTPSVNKAAETVENVQGALTYMPRTEQGMQALERTGQVMEKLGAPAEYIGEKTLQYTGSPGAATAANVLLDPVNFIGMPGSGKAIATGTKAVSRGVMQAGRAMAQDPAVGAAVERAIQRVAPAAMPMYAVKPKGGNWLAGEVEGATQPLKRETVPQELADEFGLGSGNRTQEALNNWIDKKLNRYIKNEMATPEDPVRKLADQGITHVEINPAQVPFEKAAAVREQAGFPKQGYATTQPGKNWEGMTDYAILSTKAGEMGNPALWGSPQAFRSYMALNPWVAKAAKEAPETPIYEMAGRTHTLGFDHLIDELKNSIRPDSDLPAHLRWKPEDLEKVTMEQAVRRVHDINEYRAAKKAEANEVLARNPATVDFKTYETVPGTTESNKMGLAWKEIAYPLEMPLPEGYSVKPDPIINRQTGEVDNNSYRLMSPDGEIVGWGTSEENAVTNFFGKKALKDALKYEGDVMGHCVGGYCDDVMSGNSQIYSLRDKKGEPHVTIEVRPGRSVKDETDWFTSQPENIQDEITAEALAKHQAGQSAADDRRTWGTALSEVIRSRMGEPPLEIIQIKGKGNKAPKAEYLPFVQDFVRGGNWSRVGDIENAGLYSAADVVNFMPKGFEMSRNARQLAIGRAKQAGEFPQYMTREEYENILKKYAPDDIWLKKDGMKRGGPVHISDNPDTMALELQVGGAVKAAKAAAKAAEKAAEKKALSVPYDIPRAPAKTKEEIQAIAERMAKQMTGEFVRPDPAVSKNVAGKTFEQFKREKELEKDYVTRPTKDVTPPAVADIEKQKGMVKFGIPGDTTIANQELVQAGPYRLESPAPQHGGPMFPLGGEGAWASNNPIAKNVQTRISEMSEFFDAPVLGQYMSMGPSGSMFAQHLADANLEAIDLSKMTKRQIEQFNKILREGNDKTGPRESFPGIQDKGDAYLYLSVDPKLRIYFNQLMQMPSITGPLGLPDGRVILDAITEPELRNKEIMTSGLSQFEFDPSVKPKDIPLSMHPTYSHLIPMREGAPVTRTRYPTPAELEFPDVTKFIREKYRPSEFTPTFQKASPRQKIDQQAIDEIKMYEEMMKSLTGKKKGGAVKKPAKVKMTDNLDTMRLAVQKRK